VPHKPLRPTVVFVDDEPWECFFHLSALLRRAGVRTIRVSVGHSKWQPEGLVFDRNVSLSSVPTAEQLAEILFDEDVTDIQPTESLAGTAYAALDLLPRSDGPDLWRGRAAFLDKWDVAIRLREIGLRIPDTLRADLSPPTEAVTHFALPIVLKSRVGSSGLGVEVCESLESLQKFWETIKEPREWFYERFVQGESFVCAACVGDEEIEVVATYETIERVYFRGPSTVVVLRHEPTLVDIAKRLAGVMRIRGFVCFDVIRDTSGHEWIHDVNPRVFGTFSMCQLAGYDFVGAYLKCLRGEGSIEPNRLETFDVRSYTFPSGLGEVLRSGHSGRAWSRTFRWGWRYERLLGWRYFLSWTMRVLTRSGRSIPER